MSDTTHFDIAQMVQTLNLRKGETVLVLGSRAGGLFRSKKLYETLKPFGDPSFQDLPRLEQFAHCYYLLNRKMRPGFSAADIDRILSDALREVDLSEADLYLADLIKLGLFKMVITTNMDNLVEEALATFGVRELHGFQVFSLGSDTHRDQLHFEKQVSCHIIKVFGQLTDGDYTVRRSGYFNQKPKIKDLLQEFLARDILTIGLDPVWDAELCQLIRKQGGSFWFINEEALKVDSDLAQTAEARNYWPLTGEMGNYHIFTQTLCEMFFEKFPAKMSSNYNVNGIVFRELRNLKNEVRKLREELQNCRKLP